MLIRPRLWLATAVLLASAQPARAVPDPFEAANRTVHAFNQLVRARVMAPLAELYLAHVPEPLRRGATDALANLAEPVSAASALAGGEIGIATNALARFGINTTLGLGGMRDAAAGMGFARRSFGPGDAACRWGIPSGPFLMLPLLGPSTLRDAAAQAASSAVMAQAIGADAMLAWGSAEAVVGYAGMHRSLQRLEAGALDSYAALRSAYLQRRAAACPLDRAMLMAAEE